MAEIGTRPILWHIMKQYAHYGIKDFIICGGYKIEVIKDYFMNFYIYHSDITIDLGTNEVMLHKKVTEDWNVTVVDTGMYTNVLQRLECVRDYLKKEEMFAVAYGDCVSDIDIFELTQTHRENGKLMTLAVAKPVGRNSALPITNGEFCEENSSFRPENEVWVNACNMIFSPGIFRCLSQFGSMENLIADLSAKQEISPYFHHGFWSPMETVRDRGVLDALWKMGHAPWKVWDDKEA
jgi:glucose-1-phosphate cytidylyltransferase